MRKLRLRELEPLATVAAWQVQGTRHVSCLLPAFPLMLPRRFLQAGRAQGRALRGWDLYGRWHQRA